MAATDNYKMSESNVVKVEVLRNFVNSKALASAIEEAEKLYNESNKDDYQAEAWNNVFSTTGTLQKLNLYIMIRKACTIKVRLIRLQRI